MNKLFKAFLYYVLPYLPILMGFVSGLLLPVAVRERDMTLIICLIAMIILGFILTIVLNMKDDE